MPTQNKILEVFAKVGGLVGVALFMFFSIYSRFVDLKPVIGNLGPQETYSLLRTIDGESVVTNNGVAQPHTLNHGHPVDPSILNREQILRLQVSMGLPLTGIKQNWQPEEEIKFTVSSKTEVHVTRVMSGYGTQFLDEKMVISCGENQN